MAYLTINAANLYFEAFGKDISGKTPIVLIHGSTGTGRSNWELAAPLLARDRRVIVPDCRGHGKSSNPNHSYSFREMAVDTAALIRALGYQRAHVIGHSNGGNVALVVLMEHPQVVQTAVLQAANAYVSPDLVEKEPPLFDPERVRREAPDWMNEMIALHGETHGPHYWQELLLMTVKELISEPNYTPQDLAGVRRPTLVVQGENDRVNAPFRHAQHIAGHIPDAELWIPAGIGHSVHEEILFTWVSKILDFLDRRGDEASDTIYRLSRARYADDRQTIFQVNATRPPKGQHHSLYLTGQVLVEEQRRAVLDLFSDQVVDDEMQVLLNEGTQWALVNRSVADLRREPRSLSERLNQALLGEAVRVLETHGEWAHVRLARDGYLGWLQAATLYRCERDKVEGYQRSCTHLIAGAIVPASQSAESSHGQEWAPAGLLPFGLAVPAGERRGDRLAVRKPDGGCWWVPDYHLLPLAERPGPDAAGIARTLAILRSMIGTPYLWGGCTPFGYDCSGLAQAFWGFLGVQLPRDADQQFAAGVPVEGEFQPGDLLFFGAADEPQLLPGEPGTPRRRITHVAISLGDDHVIHANGSAWGISINSLNPDHPHYQEWLKANLAGARSYA
jgi:pimeloyl-ACP methyl ester carboxylesterase/cell wall-associated NlpC family hydrolase